MEKFRCLQRVEFKVRFEIKVGFVEFFYSFLSFICCFVFEFFSQFSIFLLWEFYIDNYLIKKYLFIMVFFVILKRCVIFLKVVFYIKGLE